MRAPLVQDAAFAKDITFNGSYRYSDYSQGFNTNTYGVGLDWQIVDDVKLTPKDLFAFASVGAMAVRIAEQQATAGEAGAARER